MTPSTVDVGSWVHLLVHYDGCGIVASQLARAYFAEPAADHQAVDNQPLDWQLLCIYPARPCCWPSINEYSRRAA